MRWLYAPLRLWRHPNGKSLYALAAALFALYMQWIFTFAVLIIVTYNLYVLFDD